MSYPGRKPQPSIQSFVATPECLFKFLNTTSFLEGVIESISYRDDGASRIVTSFVVGDGDDESNAERKEHLRSGVDAASGA